MGECSAQPCGNAPVRSEQSQLAVVRIPNPLGFFIQLVPVMHLAPIFHKWKHLKEKFKEDINVAYLLLLILHKCQEINIELSVSFLVVFPVYLSLQNFSQFTFREDSDLLLWSTELPSPQPFFVYEATCFERERKLFE